MDCLVQPLTSIPHGTWESPLGIPHHLLPQTVTRHLCLLSPILNFESEKTLGCLVLCRAPPSKVPLAQQTSLDLL